VRDIREKVYSSMGRTTFNRKNGNMGLKIKSYADGLCEGLPSNHQQQKHSPDWGGGRKRCFESKGCNGQGGQQK